MLELGISNVMTNERKMERKITLQDGILSSTLRPDEKKAHTLDIVRRNLKN